MNAKILNILLWIFVTFWLVMMLNSMTSPEKIESNSLSYSQFLQELADGSLREVTIQDQTVKGVRTDGSRFETYNPGDPGLVNELLNNDVIIRATPPERPSGFLAQLLAAWLPFLLLIGVWFWFMQRNAGVGGGPGGIFNFGKSRARKQAEGRSRSALVMLPGWMRRRRRWPSWWSF